jgi:hypothetical protein
MSAGFDQVMTGVPFWTLIWTVLSPCAFAASVGVIRLQVLGVTGVDGSWRWCIDKRTRHVRDRI